MAGIRIVPFLGMLPRTAERLLGDGAAVDAENVNLSSGEIRPLGHSCIHVEPCGECGKCQERIKSGSARHRPRPT